ncbi:MAG: response regulator [Treponema sp.]|nr:response regulator [Treponema sp.]
MYIEMIIFFISLISCGIILYMLGLIWFSDSRNQQLMSFFVLGLAVCFWSLFSAITMLTHTQPYFPLIYTIRMTIVCVLPSSLLWFFLDLTGSKLAHRQAVLRLAFVFSLLDITAFITNPLHHLIFINYDHYPIPQLGPLFWVHTAFGYLTIAVGLVCLFHYIIKTAKENPSIIIAGIALLFPYGIDMLYTFEVIRLPHSLTPIAFCISFMLFFLLLYKSRLFNFKNALLATCFESYSDIILLVDRDNLISATNAAMVETFSTFKVAPKKTPLHDFIVYLKSRSSHWMPQELFDDGCIGAKDFSEGEFTLELAEKGERTFKLTRNFVLSLGQVSGYSVTLSDITVYLSMIREINEQNQRLRELKKVAESASEAKSTFLSTMSHEIRTPLNAIIGMTYIAKKNAKDEKTRASIDEIAAASTHLLEILNDILDMSKIESGKFVLSHEAFLLRKAIEEVTHIIAYRCDDKQIEFITAFDTVPDIAVLGDKLRLKQVLINLLGNAVKFTSTGGRITLLLKPVHETESTLKLTFTVSDTGIGMNEAQIARLFNPFEQTDHNIAAHFGGTGLGLAISQNLVGRMGGLITVQSQPQAGSVFGFTITLEKTPYIRDVPYHADGSLPHLAGKRILVVEDIAINRLILRELLSETQVAIDEAEDGKEALDQFIASSEYYYDLIFMDVQMPIMGGYEATRCIRRLDRPDAQGVLIIAMTANAYREDIEQALLAGMNGHLAKPIDITLLMHLLSEKFVPRGSIASGNSTLG